jgi:hypothetical protein
MREGVSFYRLSLYLASAIALIELALLMYFLSINFEFGKQYAIRFILAILIVFGLWVHSNLMRYLGGVWLAVSAVSIFWPLFSGGRWTIGIAETGLILIGILSLVTSLVLLLPKSLTPEISSLRETQPRYKKIVKKAVIATVVVAAVAATINDVMRLVAS